MPGVLKAVATLLVVALAVLAGRSLGSVSPAAGPPGLAPLSPAVREAGFSFAAGTFASDRRAFTDAVAAARPEARSLVEMVDGAVDVSFAPAGPGAVGLTRRVGERYEVVVDLEGVTRRHGRRGVSRVVLHELAHVVDFALVPESLKASLDAGIPAGYPCPPGQPTGSCAEIWERFAESFAKWATGDIGVDINTGYDVPPPNGSLSMWGAPLGRLAQSLSAP